MKTFLVVLIIFAGLNLYAREKAKTDGASISCKDESIANSPKKLAVASKSAILIKWCPQYIEIIDPNHEYKKNILWLSSSLNDLTSCFYEKDTVHCTVKDN